MITPEFLQSCTDEQINKGVAWLEVNKQFKFSNMCQFQYFACNAYLTNIRDYCTNPSDAWPIIESNNISIVFDGEPMAAIDVCFDGPFCSVGLSSFNKNPLRAAMEVYILMECSK